MKESWQTNRSRRGSFFLIQLRASIAGLCAAAGLLLPGIVDSGEPSRRMAIDQTQAELTNLVRQLEQDSPRLIQRDANGSLVAAVLPSKYLKEENFKLLSTVAHLKAITFGYSSNSDQPSSRAILNLQASKELRSLTLQCGGTVPSTVIEAIAGLDQLEELTFVGVSLANPTGYRALRGLVRLKKLTVWAPESFGTNDVAGLSSLSQVQDLQMHLLPISPSDCSLLFFHTGLTNLSIESVRWTIHFTRRPEHGL